MSTLLTITFALRSWSNGPKHVLIDSDIYTQEISNFLLVERDKKTISDYHVLASYGRAMEWVKNFPSSIGCIIVVSNRDFADDMRLIRPDLDIRKIEIGRQKATNE